MDDPDLNEPEPGTQPEGAPPRDPDPEPWPPLPLETGRTNAVGWLPHQEGSDEGATPPVPAALEPLAPGTILSISERREEAIHRAVAEIRGRGLVVVPTDTVYGIAANAFDPVATARIFEVKRRPRSLPLPVLVSRPRQAWALCAEVPPMATELAAAFWPGGLTLVLRAVEGLDWDLGDDDGTVALRIPAHTDLIDLLERAGPVACTSANLTGEPTPPEVEGIRAKLGDAVGVYLDGGRARADGGSTIVDCTGREPRLIREGPITAIQVRAVAARASG